MERKKKMRVKPLAIVLLIVAIWLGIGYYISYNRQKREEKNTRTIITELGDEFIIYTSDDLLSKTLLINEKSRFSIRIHYYEPEDNVLLLCDTENVTIYSLCSTKFCKVKKYDTYISLQSYNEDNADIYKYLREIIKDDKEAEQYLSSYLNSIN